MESEYLSVYNDEEYELPVDVEVDYEINWFGESLNKVNVLLVFSFHLTPLIPRWSQVGIISAEKEEVAIILQSDTNLVIVSKQKRYENLFKLTQLLSYNKVLICHAHSGVNNDINVINEAQIQYQYSINCATLIDCTFEGFRPSVTRLLDISETIARTITDHQLDWLTPSVDEVRRDQSRLLVFEESARYYM